MPILQKYIRETLNNADDDVDYFEQSQDSIEHITTKIKEKLQDLPEDTLKAHKSELKKFLRMLRSIS